MAPAMRHVNPGARSRHLQWDFSLNRPLPPYEPATQEQAPHSAAHSSVSECATTDETRSGTSSRWTEQQSSVLIGSWKENLAHVESARNAEAWHKILAEVNKAGAKKSVKQCRDKLRNLKMQYTKAKQHNKGTGNSPMYSPHYDELDEVLGTRAVITMPGVLQAGTPASECSTPGPQLDDRQHVSESEEEDVPLAAVAGRGLPRIQQLPMKPLKGNGGSEEEEGVSPLQQRLLAMQERQMEMFAAAERRTEDLLLRLETEQRKAEQEARARDHEFLLKVAELFSKK